MAHLLRSVVAVTSLCLTVAIPAAAERQVHAPQQLRLARIFGDGMVLQRNAKIPVWGWATPGASVRVALGATTGSARADAHGAWKAVLPPRPAGGPLTLTIKSGSESIALRDVLVGDVWIASGQSNMEFMLSQASNGPAAIAAANDSRIRQFKVPTSFAPQPEVELAGGEWSPADPQHAGAFSAVAYFFARDLRKSVDVPIGIVNTTWGGSRIEAWMSRATLGIDDAKWSSIWQKEEDSEKRLVAMLRAKMGGEPPTVDPGLVNGRAIWADPALDDAAWDVLPVPKLWEEAGYVDMDGIAWYRSSFELTADEAARGVTLGLGTIDDNDISWVNGVEIGRTNLYLTPRRYVVPASALKAGRNVIAVRVEDTGGGGGIYGDPSLLYLDVGGVKRPLANQWKFRVGAYSARPDAQRINKVPTVLYNKMINPLLPFPIKGVIWYQGESNGDRISDAAAYKSQFAAMITSWRKAWGLGDVPFLWVQLPNYMAPDAQPAVTSTWATLRESQSAALALPHTGQAVTIDVGDEHNIHPTNKQDVGARLALAARAVAYGQRVNAIGPTHRGHVVRGNSVVVQFDHAASGLVSRGNTGAVGGFAIAGADGKFVWADARIDGSTVVVSSAQVPAPVAVRYAWDNNPTNANLYSREGLPAVPFRTDSW